MKDLYICSPERFYAGDTQNYIRQRQQDYDKQWIYNLISSTNMYDNARQHEQIFINEEQWMLCKDIHPGRDTRYLVVFKDLCLSTIRALDASHLMLLEEVRTRVRAFLGSQHSTSEAADFRIFFHYMPSVYQLHAHISTHTMPAQVVRRHYLNHVIRNIKQNSHHYKNALILTSSTRKIRSVLCRQENRSAE